MSIFVREVHDCLTVLNELARTMPVDRVTLSSPCPDQSCLHVLTVAADESFETDCLDIPGPCSHCDQVLVKNDISQNNHINWATTRTGCNLLRAENLNAFLGAPIQDPLGTPVATLSVSTRLPRIWANHEIETLKLSAATLRAMLFDATDVNWHDALHHGHHC